MEDPGTVKKKKRDLSGPADLLGDDDYNLWALVQMTRQLMSEARERELSKHGISNIEASVLFVIQAIEVTHKPTTPAEISRWLFRKPNSVTELLKRMEKKGLVRKVISRDKANTKLVTLTGEGRRMYQASSERASIHRIMSCLRKEERIKLSAYLDKLRGQCIRELKIRRSSPWPLSGKFA